jgi:hypothetical protein
MDTFSSTFDVPYSKRRWSSCFAVCVETMATLFSDGYIESHELSPTDMFPWFSMMSKNLTMDQLSIAYNTLVDQFGMLYAQLGVRFIPYFRHLLNLVMPIAVF